jgi:hypothetical protein
MKYAIVLSMCLVAMFASSEAFPGFPGFPGPNPPSPPEFPPVPPEFPGFPGNDDFFGPPGPPVPPGPPGDILSNLRRCLAKKIANNETLLNNLITALNDANLSQYLITVNGSQTVNFTSLFQNYFTTLPALSSYFFTYILPSYTKLSADFNATLSVIQLLNTNQTVLMEFIGHLYIQNLFSYVSGSQGSYVVDFASIQANRKASRVLNRFIAAKVADLNRPHPFDHESDNDDEDD